MKPKARIEIKIVYDDGVTIQYERTRGGVPSMEYVASVLRWFADVTMGDVMAINRQPNPERFQADGKPKPTPEPGPGTSPALRAAKNQGDCDNE
jgi:hypothetical protein